MSHLSLIDLFRTLAKQHYKIKNTINRRHSFFRMNGENEIINASNVKVDTPAMCFQAPSGKLRRSGDVVSDNMVEFDIRKLANNGDFDLIDAVQSECKDIGFDIIAKIEAICDLQGSCGPIEDFEPENVNWEFFGPINDGYYGCRFRFFFEKSVYDPYKIDLDSIFIEDFFIPLLDYDGLPLMDFNDELLKDLE